jgi:hypothetical protein
MPERLQAKQAMKQWTNVSSSMSMSAATMPTAIDALERSFDSVPLIV